MIWIAAVFLMFEIGLRTVDVTVRKKRIAVQDYVFSAVLFTLAMSATALVSFDIWPEFDWLFPIMRLLTPITLWLYQ